MIKTVLLLWLISVCQLAMGDDSKITQIKSALEAQLNKMTPVEILVEDQQILVRGEVNQASDFDRVFSAIESVANHFNVQVAKLRTDKDIIPRALYFRTATATVNRGLVVNGSVENMMEQHQMTEIALYWLRIRALEAPELNKAIRIHPHVVLNLLGPRLSPTVSSIELGPNDNHRFGVPNVAAWQSGPTVNGGKAHLVHATLDSPIVLKAVYSPESNVVIRLDDGKSPGFHQDLPKARGKWALTGIATKAIPPAQYATEYSLTFSDGVSRIQDRFTLKNDQMAVLSLVNDDETSAMVGRERTLLFVPHLVNWTSTKVTFVTGPTGDELRELGRSDGKSFRPPPPTSSPKTSPKNPGP